MSRLFEPCTLGPLALRNRIVIPPMCQYSAEDGHVTDWHAIHYGTLSHSGAGLLIFEATAVTPEGRISPADLGLWQDSQAMDLKRLLQTLRRHSDMPLAIQLAHAGRKASCDVGWRSGQLGLDAGGWETEAASALPFLPQERTPQTLDEAGLARIRQAWVAAAVRARAAGFDAIEVHAAHGYLLHGFLSPLANTRTDAYGGSLENRMRFPLEVFAAVRAAVPGMALGVRISATDWVAGGWDVEQSIVFCQALQQAGCDYIHVSSGSLSPEQAEAAIASGQTDLVAIGRGMLYDPRWPWHAAAKLGGHVAAPPQFWRGAPRGVDIFDTEKAAP